MSTTDWWLKLNFASCVVRKTRSLGALVLCSVCNMVFVNYIYDMAVCFKKNGLLTWAVVVMHVCMFRIKRRQHNKYRRKTEADKTHAERHLFLVGEDKGVGFLLAQQRTSKCNTRYIWSTSTADTTAAAPLVPGTWYALSSVFICFPPVNFPLQSYWSLSCDHGLHYNCSDEFMWEQQQQHSSTTYILSRRK